AVTRADASASSRAAKFNDPFALRSVMRRRRSDVADGRVTHSTKPLPSEPKEPRNELGSTPALWIGRGRRLTFERHGSRQRPVVSDTANHDGGGLWGRQSVRRHWSHSRGRNARDPWSACHRRKYCRSLRDDRNG